MIVDIQTATVSIIDGVPQKTWATKETRIFNFSPIGFTSRIQLGVGAGGETYPADSRVWCEFDADIIAGNRLSYKSGTTYYDVMAVFNYEDHIEAELKKIV